MSSFGMVSLGEEKEQEKSFRSTLSTPPPKTLTEQFGPIELPPDDVPSLELNSIERIVHETWVEILVLPGQSLGLDDSFRSLGGSSLQAAEIHATLEDKLGVIISHEMLTEADTVAEMVNYLWTHHCELLADLSKK